MSKKDRQVTGGKAKDRIAASVRLYTHAFENDPVVTYMLATMPDQETRIAYLPYWFRVLMKAASMNEGIFEDIRDPGLPDPVNSAQGTAQTDLSGIEYQCASVLIRPGKKIDNLWTIIPAGFFPVLWNLGWSGCHKMLLEFEPKTQRAKKKALGKDEQYYYVFFIATRSDCRGKGLGPDLIGHHQQIATKTNHSIWLEATTPRSRDMYKKCGFTTVEEMVLGKGTVGPDGLEVKDKSKAEGVKVWGMIWRPGMDLKDGTDNVRV